MRFRAKTAHRKQTALLRCLSTMISVVMRWAKQQPGERDHAGASEPSKGNIPLRLEPVRRTPQAHRPSVSRGALQNVRAVERFCFGFESASREKRRPVHMEMNLRSNARSLLRAGRQPGSISESPGPQKDTEKQRGSKPSRATPDGPSICPVAVPYQLCNCSTLPGIQVICARS